MANHTIPMCTGNWHASPGDTVTFTNGTALPSTVTADGAWPFTAASGFSIPAAGSFQTSIAAVSHAVYYYDVSGCSRKSVTVP